MSEIFTTTERVITTRETMVDLAEVRAAFRAKWGHIPVYCAAMDAVRVTDLSFGGKRDTVTLLVPASGITYVVTYGWGPDGERDLFFYRGTLAEENAIKTHFVDEIDLVTSEPHGRDPFDENTILDHPPTFHDIRDFLYAIHAAWGW
jgi:hypothetical protein